MDRRQEPRATATTPSWSEEATEAYTEHRELLFSIGYRILGSVADTEDVLQDVWLSWAATDRGDVENPRAYLVRMTANGAMRRLDAPHRRHETYTGPWVPEPLVTDDDASGPATLADTASVALLIVLETLSPLERTVFVLREAFGYPHAEIAPRILERAAKLGMRRADEITPHWLRHTNVTMLGRAGAKLPEIQRRIGHEKITTTIDVYGRGIDDTSADVLVALDAQLVSKPRLRAVE